MSVKSINASGFYSAMQGKKENVNGSFLKLGQQEEDPVALRKTKIQQKAMKKLMDTFGEEKKIDDTMKEKRSHADTMKEEILNYQNELDGIEESRKTLKENYGITDANPEPTGSMKDYQREAAELDKYQKDVQSKLRDSSKALAEDVGLIKGIHKARLKEHPMVDAKKEADDILEAGSDEILGMLINESKDHIDEVEADQQEQAQEKKEEEDKEAKIEEKRQERENQQEQLVAKAQENSSQSSQTGNVSHTVEQNRGDAQTEFFVEADHVQTKIEKEIENLIDTKQITEEDLKGMSVDKNA